MTVDTCTRAILCALPSAVLVALKGIAQTALLEAQQQLVAAQSAAQVTQLLTAPAAIAVDLANIALDQANAINRIIPPSVMKGCPSMGEFMAQFNSTAQNSLAYVDDLRQKANRMLSMTDEVNATVDEISATIDDMNDFISAIDGCLGL
jgi:methyl-accepting chemotaxis protein